MKTIEERAIELIREQFKSTDGGIMSFDVFAAIAIAHLRDQIEDCAKIANEKADRVQSQNHFGDGMRSIADSIATAIRALAEPKIDLTADQQIEITAQWGKAAPENQITIKLEPETPGINDDPMADERREYIKKAKGSMAGMITSIPEPEDE